jgi:hypothetical protein
LPRFIVTEIEGYPIRLNGADYRSRGRCVLSCAVLDTAYNYEQVATFNEEHVVLNQHNRGVDRREAIRNRAHGLAAILEAEHA